MMFQMVCKIKKPKIGWLQKYVLEVAAWEKNCWKMVVSSLMINKICLDPWGQYLE
jgi:hypothetical protein